MDDATTHDLRAAGWTRRGIARAVDAGDLIRVRRGHYATARTPETVIRAIRVGGRLGCVSELRYRGVWVLDDGALHVQVAGHTSDLRHPDAGTAPMPAGSEVRLHWHDEAEPGPAGHASAVDALADASRCLERRAWVASVDSALRRGELSRAAVHALRQRVNAAARRDLEGVDARAESGLESIVRVLATDLGLRVRPQVTFRGVGRVDLVVEDWIVVEADGAAFHDVSMSATDRRRDAMLTAMNRTVLRPGYSLIVSDVAAVGRQLIAAVGNHRRVPRSGELAARARIRARRLGIP